MTRKAIQFANQMEPKPKFFVVCGDLVHDFSDKDRRRDQIQDYKLIFRELSEDIPLVCVCGNHDVGDQPTHESIDEYKKEFGEDYFSFIVSGCLMIVLNSSLYPSQFSDPSLVPDLVDEQNKWIDTQLARADQFKHVIIFQHIPWLLDIDSESSSRYTVEETVRIPMLEKFNEAGVKAIFCGHYHGNNVTKYKNIQHVTTTAVGAQLRRDTNGLRVVHVTDEAVEHTFHKIVPEPSNLVEASD